MNLYAVAWAVGVLCVLVGALSLLGVVHLDLVLAEVTAWILP